MSEGFELDGVRVRFGDDLILDEVTADLPDQGITVIAGPSGSGKTTLLRLLNRLEAPTSGVVRWRGEDLAATDPCGLRRQVGMVAQRPVAFEGTVADNLRVADPTLDRDAIDRLLADVGLDGLAGQSADTLSGGEAQRMVIARTLATDPVVILADEPTAALDRAPRHHLERLARELADPTRERPVGWIWVSHDLDQIHELADMVVAVVGGRILAIGSPDQLAQHERAEVRAVVER